MSQPLPTRVGRRKALWVLGGTGASLVLLGGAGEQSAVAQTFDCILSPEMTEGPYWVDERLNRSDVRSNTSTGAVKAGVQLDLAITVQQIDGNGCAVLPGAYVDIWHCDAGGLYSDVSANNTVGQNFLRGYQITDENGVARFTTIYPGWYSGRAVHIHLRVRTFNGTTRLDQFTSQLFFDDTLTDTVFQQSPYNTRGSRNTRNANDNIYNGQTRTLMTLTQTDSGYQATMNVGVDLTAPPASIPAVTAGGVVSAASYEAGVSPQGFVSIFGQNLATTTRAVADSDLINGSLPTTLGGTSVQINNKAAFLYYISPSQLNVQAPADDSVGSVPVSVTTASGTSASSSVNMQTLLPGFFLISGYVAAVRSDGVIVTGTASTASGTTQAAKPGDVLQLYGTGFGPTEPAVAPGLVFEGSYPLTSSVSVTIGGMDAPVSYAGLVATGLYQLNVTIPNLGDGDHEVIATVGGVGSPAGPLLKVQA